MLNVSQVVRTAWIASRQSVYSIIKGMVSFFCEIVEPRYVHETSGVMITDVQKQLAVAGAFS